VSGATGYWEDFEVGARYPTTSRTITDGRLFAGTVRALRGLERGKFFGPVRPGDTIRTEVEVVEKTPSADRTRGIVVFRDHVINQRGETVFQIDKVTLLKRRPV
jgi:acyl dehydratase